MSTLTFTSRGLMIRVIFPRNTNNRSQTYKMGITPLQAGPAQIEDAIGTRLDDCRDPLPGNQRHKASAQGV